MNHSAGTKQHQKSNDSRSLLEDNMSLSCKLYEKEASQSCVSGDDTLVVYGNFPDESIWRQGVVQE